MLAVPDLPEMLKHHSVIINDIIQLGARPLVIPYLIPCDIRLFLGIYIQKTCVGVCRTRFELVDNHKNNLMIKTNCGSLAFVSSFFLTLLVKESRENRMAGKITTRTHRARRTSDAQTLIRSHITSFSLHQLAYRQRSRGSTGRQQR